ncbi:MAG: tRNA lysidine(34) synthetase TilS [Rhizobacter sp.]|nr:tRNA lysidine(34) synthetase TilS [Chlorobiales bacterium]
MALNNRRGKLEKLPARKNIRRRAVLTPFEKRLLEHVKLRGLIEPGDRVLVALSGGLDSVALLHLMAAVQPYFKLSIAAAHCNFKLRGRASTADAALCKRLCLSLGVQLFTVSFETAKLAAFKKTSIEETARNLRYEFFGRLAEKHGFTKILTAHHQNDNAETVLFNLFRGASLLGLHGIRERRGKIVRPLLFALRDDLARYAGEKKFAFRNDRSNDSDVFDRNFIRLKVIPLIETRFKDKLAPSLARLSDSARELEIFANRHISSLMTEGQTAFSVRKLQSLSGFEQKEIFKRVLARFGLEPNAKMLARLSDLLRTQAGRRVTVSENVEAVWKGTRILFLSAKG